MIKAMIFSLAAFAASFGTSASAAEYEVLFVEGGFFPAVTYLSEGDIVTFTNTTAHPVEAESSNDTWRTGQLGANASYQLIVDVDTNLTFRYAAEPEKVGTLSFEPAPLN